jgi:hypothetical protein
MIQREQCGRQMFDSDWQRSLGYRKKLGPFWWLPRHMPAATED